jgi:hypothetical protein
MSEDNNYSSSTSNSYFLLNLVSAFELLINSSQNEKTEADQFFEELLNTDPIQFFLDVSYFLIQNPSFISLGIPMVLSSLHNIFTSKQNEFLSLDYHTLFRIKNFLFSSLVFDDVQDQTVKSISVILSIEFPKEKWPTFQFEVHSLFHEYQSNQVFISGLFNLLIETKDIILASSPLYSYFEEELLKEISYYLSIVPGNDLLFSCLSCLLSHLTSFSELLTKDNLFIILMKSLIVNLQNQNLIIYEMIFSLILACSIYNFPRMNLFIQDIFEVSYDNFHQKEEKRIKISIDFWKSIAIFEREINSMHNFTWGVISFFVPIFTELLSDKESILFQSISDCLNEFELTEPEVMKQYKRD